MKKNVPKDTKSTSVLKLSTEKSKYFPAAQISLTDSLDQGYSVTDNSSEVRLLILLTLQSV